MNILQICHKPPYPPIDGGSIAMYSLYNGLIENGNNVHILAMNTHKQYCDLKNVPSDFKSKSKYLLVDIDIRIKILPAFLNLFTGQSYNITRFNSINFSRAIRQVLNKHTYDVIILESLYTTPYIHLLRKYSNAKLVLRAHNAEFKIWENLAQNENNILKKCYLNLLSRRLKKYELSTLDKVNLIASISDKDNLVFKNSLCKTPMIYLPFGINFNDEEFKHYTPPEIDELVLFHIGSMDWLPHQEAFKWFFENVWEQIYRTLPHVKLYLAGAKMPDWLTNMNYSNVFITNSYVDGKIFMNKKAIMIVPSFSGSGIRIKIAEGMAKGKVILTTSNGAMGIPCIDRQNIFISDKSDEWISIIFQCMNDLELVKKVSQEARQFSKTEFEYRLSAKKLTDALNHT
ncbi:MAG TPA: glycosyltransferase family 4 protein [Bacteroidia bacterium]|nr:glycosyltransferase family 4 protein [Bacteroidia bacterium]